MAEVSARIDQLLAVLREIRGTHPATFYGASLARLRAVDNVAASRGVLPQAVRDTYGRYLGLPQHGATVTFDGLVWNWLHEGSAELQRTLADHASKRSAMIQAADLGAIERFFANADSPREEPLASGIAEKDAPQTARRPTGGQGFNIDAQHRKLIDDYAVRFAERTLASLESWQVRRVDRTAAYPFDLTCSIRGETDLHVEVKGTTTLGERVLVTANEVESARKLSQHTMLFVVFDIEIIQPENGTPTALGGDWRYELPWRPEEERLKPVNYWYTLRT